MNPLLITTVTMLSALMQLEVGCTAVKRFADNTVGKAEAMKAMSRILCACATNNKENTIAADDMGHCIDQGRKKALDCARQGRDAVNKCHDEMLQFIHGDCSPDAASCRSPDCLKKGVAMNVYPLRFSDAADETTADPLSTSATPASQSTTAMFASQSPSTTPASKSTVTPTSKSTTATPPASKSTTATPASKITTATPASKITTATPASKITTAMAASKSTTATPASKSTTATPALKSTTATPTSQSPSTTPVSKSTATPTSKSTVTPTSKSTTATPASKSITATTASKSTAATPASKITTATPASKSTTATTTSKSTSAKSTSQSPSTTSVSKSKATHASKSTTATTASKSTAATPAPKSTTATSASTQETTQYALEEEDFECSSPTVISFSKMDKAEKSKCASNADDASVSCVSENEIVGKIRHALVRFFVEIIGYKLDFRVVGFDIEGTCDHRFKSNNKRLCELSIRAPYLQFHNETLLHLNIQDGMYEIFEQRADQKKFADIWSDCLRNGNHDQNWESPCPGWQLVKTFDKNVAANSELADLRAGRVIFFDSELRDDRDGAIIRSPKASPLSLNRRYNHVTIQNVVCKSKCKTIKRFEYIIEFAFILDESSPPTRNTLATHDSTLTDHNGRTAINNEHPLAAQDKRLPAAKNEDPQATPNEVPQAARISINKLPRIKMSKQHRIRINKTPQMGVRKLPEMRDPQATSNQRPKVTQNNLQQATPDEQ